MIALSGLAALGAGTAAAYAIAVGRAEDALSGRGLSWSSRALHLRGATWRGVTRPGVEVERVDLDLFPPVAVRLRGATVDLSRIEPGSGVGAGGLSLPVPVGVDGLALRWGETEVARDLRGTLLPRLDLQGEGVRLDRAPGEAWSGQVDRHLSFGPVSGDAHLDVRFDGVAEARLAMPDAVLSHPLVASRPLPPAPLTATATWNPVGGAFAGSLAFGPVRADLSGVFDPAGPTWSADVHVPDVSLDAVAALFGPLVPEASSATIRGTVGLDAHVEGFPLRWAARPRAAGLGADDVVPDPRSFRHGSFSWRAASAGGDWTVRTAGEGTYGWVPLAEAGLVPEAVIAAEDAAFWTHAGYDLGAVQEALDGAASGADGDLRGGSTLTQQLAKNLFLDGERTFARKLRELLYALEMERELGKERILELYLNVVELGPGIWGLAAATDAYFLKRPDRLSAREAAFLAAILPAPRRWYERSAIAGRPPDARIDAILGNMVDGGAISDATADRARREGLRFVPVVR